MEMICRGTKAACPNSIRHFSQVVCFQGNQRETLSGEINKAVLWRFTSNVFIELFWSFSSSAMRLSFDRCLGFFLRFKKKNGYLCFVHLVTENVKGMCNVFSAIMPFYSAFIVHSESNDWLPL